MAGLEGLFVFVFPFPQAATGCDLDSREDWNQKFVSHRGGVAEVIGVDLTSGDLWIIRWICYSKTLDKLGDLFFVGFGHAHDME